MLMFFVVVLSSHENRVELWVVCSSRRAGVLYNRKPVSRDCKWDMGAVTREREENRETEETTGSEEQANVVVANRCLNRVHCYALIQQRDRKMEEDEHIIM